MAVFHSTSGLRRIVGTVGEGLDTPPKDTASNLSAAGCCNIARQHGTLTHIFTANTSREAYALEYLKNNQALQHLKL